MARERPRRVDVRTSVRQAGDAVEFAHLSLGKPDVSGLDRKLVAQIKTQGMRELLMHLSEAQPDAFALGVGLVESAGITGDHLLVSKGGILTEGGMTIPAEVVFAQKRDGRRGSELSIGGQIAISFNREVVKDVGSSDLQSGK